MNRLRAWRAANDVSLGEAADLTGYSEAHISRIERGQRTPSPRARVVIARRLGARVGDLFDPEPVPDELDALGVGDAATA